MKHLGDITKIDGSKVPVVDCVIGGSPCQDLSVAGKRAGLDGERSGLFMEQIRIIKEMRENDKRTRGFTAPEFVRPRYMLWENVPGAFSSNKGEDFRVALEETARVCQKDAIIPMPKDGKWRTSGCIVGNGWSIAWRVFDAQFWGVPQRRKRIALVADFGGESAAEILFVRKGVSGDSEESREERETTTNNIKSCFGTNNREGDELGGTVSPASYNQAVSGDEAISYIFQPISIENHPADSRVDIDKSGKIQTLTSRMGTGGCNVPLVLVLDRASFNQGKNAQFDFEISDNGISSSLVARGPSAVAYGIAPARYIVRRLTPLECERLQGFPDGWTDIGNWIDSRGKTRFSSDAVRYKSLGNSIALPPWKWILKRLCAYYEREATIASLFDGIGGFPYLWEMINGKGSCLWASEIEDFPIAVTKKRIGE